MKRKNIIFWIVCLVIADQGVKLIIANFFIDTRFDIIDSILGLQQATFISYWVYKIKKNRTEHGTL